MTLVLCIYAYRLNLSSALFPTFMFFCFIYLIKKLNGIKLLSEAEYVDMVLLKNDNF